MKIAPSLSPDPAGSVRSVATFWHGPPLARLDIACLLSFVQSGFDVTIYGFETIEDLPAEVQFRRADEVVDRRFLDAFVVKGRPSLAHFSDFFRYKLFQGSDAAWVDMDLLCIRPFSIPLDSSFIAKESPSSISNSVLRIRAEEPALQTIIDTAERFANGQSFKWGATGPALLTETFGPDVLNSALAPHHFFPIPWDEWWKPFTPSARQECDRLCRDATAIHLWNNIVERSGYWKDLAPPPGSYLHAVLSANGSLGLFRDICPPAVMEHIASNYRNSRTAAHFTVKELISITVPRVVSGVRKRVSRG